MKKLSLIVIVAILALCSAPAMADGPDGVRFQSWWGSTAQPVNKDVQLADCTIGDFGFTNTVHDPNLYIERAGVKYSSYDMPAPSDEWHPVSWNIVVDILQTATLRVWSSAIQNPNLRYGVHGEDEEGNIVFHAPVYGDMITTTLGPGRYNFTATASVISSVPEPGSMLALASGLIGAFSVAFRRRR